MMSIVLPIVLGLHAALTAQALSTNRHSSSDSDVAEAAGFSDFDIRDFIEASLRALHPHVFEANFVPDEYYREGLKELSSEYGLKFDFLDDAADGARVRRATEPEGNPDDDAEEVEEDEEQQQPPATGLRRWVIRIRNVMYGRRDLEGTEGGEAEGEPEAGRTWVESLAQWFAHGIKRLLIRLGGGGEEEAGEATENPKEEVDETASPRYPTTTTTTTTTASAPVSDPASVPGAGRASRRRPITTSTAGSAPEPAPPTPKPRTTAMPPTPTPDDVPAPAPASTARTTTALPGMVYDDEAFGGSDSSPAGAPEETNELS